MNARETHKKVLAAHVLLLEPSTSLEKFKALRTLLSGINPKMDQLLAECERGLSTIDKVQQGAFVELTAENLPEATEEQKRRKRLLLLLLQSWKQLQSEVARVEKELAAAESAEAPTERASHLGRILNFAKGPFGIITAIALVGVISLQQTAVNITIQNQDCGTLHVSSSVPISLPGLKLPSEPIQSGDSATITIPPLPVHVDGRERSILKLTAAGYSFEFNLSSGVREVTMNGASLLGKETDISLSERKEHTLVLRCS